MTDPSPAFFSPDTAWFPLAAPDRPSLIAQVRQLAARAEGPLQPLAAASLEAADPRAPARAAVVAGTGVELRQRLALMAHALEEPTAPGAGVAGVWKDPTQHAFHCTSPAAAAPRIAFLYPGQGCQRLNMGRVLIERFPWARQMLGQAEQVLSSIGAPALEPRMLRPVPPGATDADPSWFAALSDVEAAGPAIILTSALWTRFLEILGVHPRAVGGHSQGEQSAFHAAGAVDFAGVMQLSAFMGRAGSPRYNRSTPGGMAVLACPAQAARDLLATVSGEALVANVNAPSQVVVSGTRAAIDAILAAAAARDIEARALPVSHAFHSPLVADGGEYLRANGPGLPPVAATRAQLYSCMDARLVPAGTRPLEHFAAMVVRPVDFLSLVRTMSPGVDLFLELGAGRALSGLVQAIDPRATCLPVEPIPGRSRALDVAFAALFTWGAPVRWEIVARGLSPPPPARRGEPPPSSRYAP